MRAAICISLVLLAGCDRSSHDFRLPAGQVEQGRANYVLLQCNDCHVVADIAWQGQAGDPKVTLGGESTRLRSQAELVTSIINPNHQLARPRVDSITDAEGNSRMRGYNEVMSVQELIDLVAFLESEYQLWTPDFSKAKGTAP